MRPGHIITIVAGLGWIIFVAFATGSFFFSVIPGAIILIAGMVVTETRQESERRQLSGVILYNNAVIRQARAQGREPEDSELRPEPAYNPGTWAMFLAVAVIGIILLAIVMFTPSATIEQMRESSPYVEENAQPVRRIAR